MCRHLVVAVLLALTACAASTSPDPGGDGAGGGVGDAGVDFSSQSLEVIGFGDSVTAGCCASSGHSYVSLLLTNDDARYPDFAGRDLQHRFASVVLKNIAVIGSTSCEHTPQRIHQELAASGPRADRTVVVITLGGNDLFHPYRCRPSECAAYCATVVQATPWAAAFKARLIAQINALRDGASGIVTIMLGNIYDPTDGVGDIENAPVAGSLPPWPEARQVLALYNQTLAEIALETGATLVDLRTAMLGHGIHWNDSSNPFHPATPAYWYCANLEDPNDMGYDAIRRAFWSQLATTMGYAP